MSPGSCVYGALEDGDADYAKRLMMPVKVLARKKMSGRCDADGLGERVFPGFAVERGECTRT